MPEARPPSSTGTTSTTRAVLENFEPTGIYAQYVYEIEGAADGAGYGATIGYQDGDASFGDIQFGFNTSTVNDGSVLSLLINVPSDLDEDLTVGIMDFVILISAWGPCADCQACPADLDGDCIVGPVDLAILLADWS